MPAEEKGGSDLLGWTAATAAPQIDVALRHPKVKLVANALGTPPADVIERIHDSGRLMAALCGATKHALAQKKAGVDILIAQGHEGGGHCGEIGSMVLWPEVIDAVAPIPVLAAGGIGTRQADRGGARDGRAGRVDGIDLADRAGSRHDSRAARSVLRGDQRRHRALAIVHRQAGADAAQRLDAGVGSARRAQAAADADAISRGRAGRGTRAPLRGEGESCWASIRSGKSSAA